MYNIDNCEKIAAFHGHKCGEKAREDRVRLEDGKPVCLSCFREYDR